MAQSNYDVVFGPNEFQSNNIIKNKTFKSGYDAILHSVKKQTRSGKYDKSYMYNEIVTDIVIDGLIG